MRRYRWRNPPPSAAIMTRRCRALRHLLQSQPFHAVRQSAFRFYEAKTSRTLDQNGGRPDCSQGGIAVVAFSQNQRDEIRDLKNVSGALAAEPGTKQQTYVLQGSMIGRADKNGPQGDGVNEDVSFTLDTSDRHVVAYCMTTGEFTRVASNSPRRLWRGITKTANVVIKEDNEAGCG